MSAEQKEEIRKLRIAKSTLQRKLNELKAKVEKLEDERDTYKETWVERGIEIKRLEAHTNKLVTAVQDCKLAHQNCPDCGATQNFIGKGLYECWKCTALQFKGQISELECERDEARRYAERRLNGPFPWREGSQMLHIQGNHDAIDSYDNLITILQKVCKSHEENNFCCHKFRDKEKHLPSCVVHQARELLRKIQS